MKKQPDFFLRHMLDAIEKIEEYIEGMNRDLFLRDHKTIDAVIRQFEILGEAAGRVPTDHVSDCPIRWQAIAGLRNKLIHGYFGVDPEIVWKTATSELDELKRYLTRKVS